MFLLSAFLTLYWCRRSVRGVRTFLVMSCGVLAMYWVWVSYLRWGEGETEASKEVGTSFFKVLILLLSVTSKSQYSNMMPHKKTGPMQDNIPHKTTCSLSQQAP